VPSPPLPPEAEGPLTGIRVVDLSRVVSGPLCGRLLADLGAEVIKVEPPGGDAARLWGPPFWGPDSTLFLSVNRGRKSVVLDLRKPEGREALHRIAGNCDVFVQASRLGVAERRGFDYEAIRGVRPDVVHMSITAYGDRGPLKDAPGYDPLMQAFSGIMSLTGHPDGPPARVGGSVVEFGTGMWAAIAILAALRSRDLNGDGARLDTSLLDTSLGWVSYHLMGYLASSRVPERMGSAMDSIVPYQAFATSDGYLMIACGSEAIFRRLCDALEVPALATDERFATNPSRVAHRAELIPILEGLTRERTTAALLDLLGRHAVPASPLRGIGEVADDEQVAATGMLLDRENRRVPDYRDVGLPLRMNGTRPPGGMAPPDPGEHTREVLSGVGFGADEIDRMLLSGAAALSARAPAAAVDGGDAAEVDGRAGTLVRESR
jgi:crotonobetainyl-CoA:carnitine CoA-transferase CaiB-like acyl-CoA transferase